MDQNFKNVLLFGRTGAGKSSLGNMLIDRHPNPKGGFQVGNGVRGVTSNVDFRRGNRWFVTDTIGMGEAEGATVSSEQAQTRLCEFFKQLKLPYLYIMYVVKKGRLSKAEQATWHLFKKLFEGGEKNFVVVFTGANEKWLAKELPEIKKVFNGCDRFCAVNLPSEDSEDETTEDSTRVEEENKRLKSIKALEEKLEGYGLKPTYPKISRMSDMELLEHVKMSIRDTLEFIMRTFADLVDNPATWLANQLIGRVQ